MPQDTLRDAMGSPETRNQLERVRVQNALNALGGALFDINPVLRKQILQENPAFLELFPDLRESEAQISETVH